MTNDEAVERLKVIDFERSNSRDRLAIHTAINALSDQPRTVAEIRAEVESIRQKYFGLDLVERLRGDEDMYCSEFSIINQLLDFIDGGGK